MPPPSADDGTSCSPTSCSPPSPPSSLSLLLALSPFLASFALIFSLATSRIFPRLARLQPPAADEISLPTSAPPSLRQATEEHSKKGTRRRVAAGVFGITLGLAGVLAELILAEIWDVEWVVGRGVRQIGLRGVVPGLVGAVVGVVPGLVVESWVVGKRGKGGRRRKVVAGLVWMGWLGLFWSVPGRVVEGDGEGGVVRGCLERVGVIGIALMAGLSGFASVSSPWQRWADGKAHKRRPVTDTDIERKEAGVEATGELLATKRHRLRMLQKKVAEGKGGGGGKNGVMGKVFGSLKGMAGGGDAAEIKTLQLEISGLETMEANLAASLSLLKTRKAVHARDGTALGKLLEVPSYAFSIYCVYRVLATTLTTIRRATYPNASFSSSDPINRFLGLLAKYWNPKLDQVAWARQISFLLSGVILAASANSVLQTFHLFSKWMPGLLYQAQANLALLIGQIAATYVISSALLLRSNLPREVGRSVGDALESALEPAFVDRWFEGWFLSAAILTAVGIFLGRKSSGPGDDWDDDFELAAEEMGLGQKQS